MTVLPHEAPLEDAPHPVAPGDADDYFRRYGPWLLAYCTSRLGSRDEAEDALQSAYLNAWRALQRGATPRHPAAWLFAVTRNVCHEKLRSRWQRSSHEEPYEPQELAGVAAAPPSPPVSQLTELTAAVAALPPNQRRALLLREWRGLPYDEIATELGVSRTAVEMLLFRARRAVARRLQADSVPGRNGRALGALAFFGPLADLFRGSREALAALSPAKAAVTVAAVVSAPAVTIGVMAIDRNTAAAQSDPHSAPSVAVDARADGARDPARPIVGSLASPAHPRGKAHARLGVAAAAKRSGTVGATAFSMSGNVQPHAGGSDGQEAGATAGPGGAGGGGGSAAPGDGGTGGQPNAGQDVAAPGGSGGGGGGTGGGSPPGGGSDGGGGAGGGRGGATPATPAVPATPHHHGVPATPATPAAPATPPPHSNGGKQGKNAPRDHAAEQPSRP